MCYCLIGSCCTCFAIYCECCFWSLHGLLSLLLLFRFHFTSGLTMWQIKFLNLESVWRRQRSAYRFDLQQAWTDGARQRAVNTFVPAASLPLFVLVINVILWFVVLHCWLGRKDDPTSRFKGCKQFTGWHLPSPLGCEFSSHCLCFLSFATTLGQFPPDRRSDLWVGSRLTSTVLSGKPNCFVIAAMLLSALADSLLPQVECALGINYEYNTG